MSGFYAAIETTRMSQDGKKRTQNFTPEKQLQHALKTSTNPRKVFDLKWVNGDLQTNGGTRKYRYSCSCRFPISRPRWIGSTDDELRVVIHLLVDVSVCQCVCAGVWEWWLKHMLVEFRTFMVATKVRFLIAVLTFAHYSELLLQWIHTVGSDSSWADEHAVKATASPCRERCKVWVWHWVFI